jgi:D-aminoacyl-tRNA deacylase
MVSSLEFAVIVSKADPAGMNIASFLEGNLPHGMRLHFIEGNQCFADSVDEIRADAFVFASKHRSESGKPTLTVHAPGNWGKAELGGKDRTLVPTNAALIKNYLAGLQKQKESLSLPFEVSLECTHHGPFLSTPSVFIELGSSDAQWGNKKAGEAIAEVILHCTSTAGNFKPAIALGGGHYCPDFTKLVLRTNYALGHICPQYALQNFDAEMLERALAATIPKPEAVILDWKGLKGEKERISELLSKQRLPAERLQKLLKQP